MAENAKNEKGFFETVEEKLVSKWGSVPVWAVVIGVLGYGVYYFYDKVSNKYK